MIEAIEKLKDDSQYYGDFGKQYLSNSDIGTLLKNPREFKKSQPDNPVFAKGRYFHQLILEPEKAEDWDFVDVASRNTKAYKEYCASMGVDFALLERERIEIQGWAAAMMSNFEMYVEISREDAEYEVPQIMEIKGEMWKGKADIVTSHQVIDLKTTSDIGQFRWNARKYNYDSQAYIYGEMFGKPLVFFVIDKISKMLGVFEPTPAFLASGEEKVEKAVEVYRKFFGSDAEEDIDTYIIHEFL